MCLLPTDSTGDVLYTNSCSSTDYTLFLQSTLCSWSAHLRLGLLHSKRAPDVAEMKQMSFLSTIFSDRRQLCKATESVYVCVNRQAPATNP